MDQFFYQRFFVTMISFLLLNAFLPMNFRHFRRVYLVTQTLWFFYLGRTEAHRNSVENTYITFAVTALFLYFFHTHEYIGEKDME